MARCLWGGRATRSSLKLPGTQSSSNTAQGSQTPGAQFPAQTVEDKLAVGSLKLEGSGAFYPLDVLPGLAQARVEALKDLVQDV